LTVKVSVVVPVYNPGEYIDPCIESLLSQSLPRAELELLFVNDGSTDDSLARLETYAAAHSQVRILSIPNSGWPGKPRNVGTDAAVGEYVMFVDQDDRLEPESLQRMYEMGHAHDADVILGKVISDFRGVHHALYRESRPHCTVYTAHLMNSLTPHKMLRTAFLRARNIRYAEGPRRLEDQLFMTKAYFAATGASIVADYVCYRYLRRPDGKNAGSKRIIPAEYYGNLGEVLDVVDAYTDPGEVRDGFYRRFLRTEMLGRLDAPNLLSSPPDYLKSLLDEVRGLLEHRFPRTVDTGLGAALRCRAVLAREGTATAIATQADSIRMIRVAAEVVAVDLSDGTIRVDVQARLLHDEAPLRLDRDEDLRWLLPVAVTGAVVSREDRTVEDPAQMSADVVIKHRDLADEWFLPSSLKVAIERGDREGQMLFHGHALLDPRRAAGGRAPLRKGIYDLYLRVEVFGLTRSGRLDARRVAGLTPPVFVDDRGQINRPYVTANGKLSVNTDALPKWLSHALRSGSFVGASTREVVLDLGVVWAVPPSHVTLTVTSEKGRSVSWQLRPEGPGSTRWHALLSVKPLRLLPGDHRARLSVPAPAGGNVVKVTMENPFPVTGPMVRAALRGSLGYLADRGLRRLRNRVQHERPHPTARR